MNKILHVTFPNPIILIEIIYYNFDRNNTGNVVFDKRHRYASRQA